MWTWMNILDRIEILTLLVDFCKLSYIYAFIMDSCNLTVFYKSIAMAIVKKIKS